MNLDTDVLDHAEEALLPNDDDVVFYEEHGYWISLEIIPSDVLDAAEVGVRRHHAGDVDTAWPGVATDWRAGEGLRKNDYASLHVRELARLVHTPLLAATAARLARTDSIRLWHDQLLYKPTEQPGTTANVGWHTDRQYWPTCNSVDMLTAWVGFHDVDETGGSVSFLDGSHRWDGLDLDFFDQDLGRLADDVRAAGHVYDKRAVTLRRGQVSFHHCRTVHGSGPNHADGPRRSLAIHLQPADNRWQANRLPDGSLAAHANDQFVRHVDGAPDYADPALCPVLWPVGRPRA